MSCCTGPKATTLKCCGIQKLPVVRGHTFEVSVDPQQILELHAALNNQGFANHVVWRLGRDTRRVTRRVVRG